MLWFKGWLETRWRLLYALAVPLIVTLSLRYSPGLDSPEDALRMMFVITTMFIFALVFLAGTGIRTQTPLGYSKGGLYGSTYFTLSLPVSRFRLLAVRAVVGLAGTAVVIALVLSTAWAMFPLIRADSTPADLLKFILTSFLCISCFYFLSALLAIFLDEVWQAWGSIIVIGLIFWLTRKMRVPPALDVFGFMGAGSPLITHTMPWGAIAISLGASVALFFTTLKILQTREY